MDLERVTGEIVDSAVKLHMALGPGLFESAYEALLAQDLVRRGFTVERQKLVSFEYRELRLADAFRVDLLVDGAVVVEVKSVEKLAPVHLKQVLTYIRLLDVRVGLLLNFGGATLIEGLHRIVNRYTPPPTPLLRVNRR